MCYESSFLNREIKQLSFPGLHSSTWHSFCQSRPLKQDFNPRSEHCEEASAAYNLNLWWGWRQRVPRARGQQVGLYLKQFHSIVWVLFLLYSFQDWFFCLHTALVSYLKWTSCLLKKVFLLTTIIVRIPNGTSIPGTLNASLAGFRILM